MSWNALLRALGEEVAREARDIVDRARADATRTVEAAREQVAAERDRALAEARERAREEARRASAAARRDQDRALLEALGAALRSVREEALARATGAGSPPALVEALAAEVGEREAEWIVDPGEEEGTRAQLDGRGSVRARAERRGGPEVQVPGAVLDATAAARIERAWPELEPRLCAILLGELHGRM